MVGDAGLVARWDGSAWDGTTAVTAAPLYAIHGAADGSAWAVGDKGTIIRWDKIAWRTVMAEPSLGILASVWVRADDDVWVGGESVLHWDGKTWSKMVDAPAGGSVFSPAHDDVWLVDRQRYLRRMVSGSWTKVNVGPSTGKIQSVTGSGPNEVWALVLDGPAGGEKGYLYVWNGQKWTQLIGGIEDAEYGTLSSPGAGEVWLTGFAQVQRWRDNELKVMQTGLVQNTWARTSSDVWIAGEAGSFLHWEGNGSTETASGFKDDLWGVTAAGPRSVWAAGQSPGTNPTGTVLSWDGSVWRHEVLPAGTPPLSSIWAQDTSVVWAAGTGPSIVRRTNTGWGAVETGSDRTEYRRITGVGSEVWAVGDEGRIWHATAASKGAVTPVVTDTLLGAVTVGTDQAWAVGANGRILRWKNQQWAPVSSGTVSALYDICAPGSSDAWAVGQDGTILRWSGSAWSPSMAGVPGTAVLTGIWCRAPDELWAITWDGSAIYRGNGATWTATASPTTAPLPTSLYSITGAPDAIWVVGAKGTVLRKALASP